MRYDSNHDGQFQFGEAMVAVADYYQEVKHLFVQPDAAASLITEMVNDEYAHASASPLPAPLNPYQDRDPGNWAGSGDVFEDDAPPVNQSRRTSSTVDTLHDNSLSMAEKLKALSRRRPSQAHY